MTFLRSSAGISNYNKFSKVDLLVYSEGGNVNRPIDGSECNIWSIDSVFWRSIFSRFFPDKTFKIKSLGSKNNVIPYARKIANSEVRNSIAVMDRDHDAHKGSIIVHPCVIYTHGYSWENDAWRIGVLLSCLSSLHPEGQLTQDTVKKIEARYDSFLKSVWRIAYIDVLCSIRGVQGVPKEKFGEFIDIYSKDGCKLRRDSFKALIRKIKENRTDPFRYHGRFRFAPLVDCYGKLFAEFSYGVLSDYYKLFTDDKVFSRSHADQMIVKAIDTVGLERFDPYLNSYYVNALSNVRAAVQ
jgi:hypothetical protein